MTKIVLGDAAGGMVARKRGAIVNTSSAAGTQISPLLAGYSAAKGGVVAFSRSLHYELKPKGIDVQVQTPLWVTTKLAKIRKTSLTVPSPAAYAKAAANCVARPAARLFGLPSNALNKVLIMSPLKLYVLPTAPWTPKAMAERSH